MYKIKNFFENDDVKIIDSQGAFSVIEYQKDLSVMPETAMMAFYASQMNVKKRQVVCDISKSNVTVQAGAMQWTAGNVNATTGIKGVGDFFGKFFHLDGKVLRKAVVECDKKDIIYCFVGVHNNICVM